MAERFFIYGPPGSGKSTLGQALAQSLGLGFVDLDARIEADAGRCIREIFATEGEASFRGRETRALKAVLLEPTPTVIALGGGALLDAANRALVETHGPVLCLEAPLETILARTSRQPGLRPLLAAESGIPDPGPRQRLMELLSRRAGHYAGFSRRLDASGDDLDAKLEEARILCGAFRVHGMGAAYDVRVGQGNLLSLGEAFRSREWRGASLVVADDNTHATYGKPVARSLREHGVSIGERVLPAGEVHKGIESVTALWRGALRAGVARDGSLIAVGGGVVGDLAGFAAATWMRGVRWVGVPTTLLAMVDSSLGGKTAFDLPEGKNLVGAFHAPSLVLVDTATLETLPLVELRCGMAEAVKHGAIGDPLLFERLEVDAADLGQGRLPPDPELVARAMAVKVRTIETDPYEQGVRAALNLGHTVGHAIEIATHWGLRHGEAVSVGMVAEARLAEEMRLCEKGLAARMADVLRQMGLPVEIPAGIDRDIVMEALRLDKKRKDGVVRFALPIAIGRVECGVVASESLLREILASDPAATGERCGTRGKKKDE